MDVTIFLAQIWGVVLLAIGLGVLVSPAFYKKIYKDIEKEPLAVLMFAMISLSTGVVHITFHNVWGNVSESLVSLFGWLLLVKGAILAIAPNFTDKVGNWYAKVKIVQTMGWLAVLLGAYLCYVGFLA